MGRSGVELRPDAPFSAGSLGFTWGVPIAGYLLSAFTPIPARDGLEKVAFYGGLSFVRLPSMGANSFTIRILEVLTIKHLSCQLRVLASVDTSIGCVAKLIGIKSCQLMVT